MNIQNDESAIHEGDSQSSLLRLRRLQSGNLKDFSGKLNVCKITIAEGGNSEHWLLSIRHH